MDKEKILEALNPEIIERFKEAVAIGKWPDGKVLSTEQKEICIQAIITYENQFVDEHERTAYVPPKSQPCDSTDTSTESPAQTDKIVWKK